MENNNKQNKCEKCGKEMLKAKGFLTCFDCWYKIPFIPQPIKEEKCPFQIGTFGCSCNNCYKKIQDSMKRFESSLEEEEAKSTHFEVKSTQKEDNLPIVKECKHPESWNEKCKGNGTKFNSGLTCFCNCPKCSPLKVQPPIDKWEEFKEKIRKIIRAGVREYETWHGKLEHTSSVEKRIAGYMFEPIKSFIKDQVSLAENKLLRRINESWYKEQRIIREDSRLATLQQVKEKIKGMKVKVPEGKDLDKFTEDREREIHNSALDDLLTNLDNQSK